MLITATAQMTDEDVGDLVPDLLLKLRVSEVCRNACRLFQHVPTEREFAEVVVQDIVNGLDAAAAAIWELDRKTDVWTLMGAGGDFEEQGLRSWLGAVRAGGGRSDRILVQKMIEDVQHGLRSTAANSRCTGIYSASSAMPLRSEAQALRVAAIWSRKHNDDQLQAALESIALDVGLGFDAIQSRSDRNVLARLCQALFENIPCAVTGVDEAGRCTRWNRAASELFGWDAAEVVGKPLRVVPPECQCQLETAVEACRDGMRPVEIRASGRDWDGSHLRTHVLCLPILQPDGTDTEVLLVISDETSQDYLERIAYSESDVAALFSTSTSMERVGAQALEAVCRRMDWLGAELWQLSDDGERWKCSIVWKSPEFTAGPANSIIAGRSLRCDVGLPGEVRRTKEIVTSGADDNRHDIAVPIRCDNDIQAVVVFLGTQEDGLDARLQKGLRSISLQIGQALSRERTIESLRTAEEKLQQTRKMEAVGMLAGGIAHDFNNLLMVILGNCELLQSGAADNDQASEMIEEIRQVGERAATLTRKLLTFSRKRTAEPEALNASQILKECVGMLERLVGDVVMLETQIDEHVHPIRIDRIEFEQVILNLVANARDAMPEGGQVSISLHNVTLALKDVVPHPEVRPGDFVALTVADTGCGMDEETQSRAFEPFFTTKGNEKGTGLGLATVYGIVRRSQGLVQLESAPGAGTRFTVFIPRASLGIKPRLINAPPRHDPRGTETILVVDDEDALRRLVQRVLEVHGYKVIAADCAETALHHLQQPATTCDLLLTDVVMPRMKGQQLAREARKLRPGLPTLFMSGYCEASDMADASDDEPILCKPFSSDVLAEAVRRTLNRSRV